MYANVKSSKVQNTRWLQAQRRSSVNLSLLEATLAKIQWLDEHGPDQDGDSWNQDLFICPTSCGTAYCFAGWACKLAHFRLEELYVTLDGKSVHEVVVDHNGNWDYIYNVARDILGLDGDSATELFDSSNTIKGLERKVDRLILNSIVSARN